MDLKFKGFLQIVRAGFQGKTLSISDAKIANTVTVLLNHF